MSQLEEGLQKGRLVLEIGLVSPPEKALFPPSGKRAIYPEHAK